MNQVVKINRDLHIIGYGKIGCNNFLKFEKKFENKYGKFIYARAKNGELLLLNQKDCTIMEV